MKTWIGTSGFQYPEWKGKFYPETMSTAKMLTFYSGQFNTTEVNYTFRSIPSTKTIQRWCNETPQDFRFSLKAPQRVTHFAKLKGCGPLMKVFAEAVSGLGDKTGPVLFQLPPTFKNDTALLTEFLSGLPDGMRTAFEFRHESWFTDDVFATLSKHNTALCIAESEDLETPREITASFGYLRLRREDYTAKDTKEQAKFLSRQAKAWREAFIYFKHEETCVGPGFASALMEALND